jgi:hypothetical protein
MHDAHPLRPRVDRRTVQEPGIENDNIKATLYSMQPFQGWWRQCRLGQILVSEILVLCDRVLQEISTNIFHIIIQ